MESYEDILSRLTHSVSSIIELYMFLSIIIAETEVSPAGSHMAARPRTADHRAEMAHAVTVKKKTQKALQRGRQL